MEIKLSNYEVMEALYAYLEKNYALDISEDDLFQYPLLEYCVETTVFKKNKSGSFQRRKGALVKDLELSTRVDSSTQMNWDSTITLFVDKQS
jgi:hypothetical protein|tara:strand:+ start:287 stop:562 length:276 start_codon:yes stop_codon:yes gene_type:complete